MRRADLQGGEAGSGAFLGDWEGGRDGRTRAKGGGL
jgi:hypothetical protein